MNSRPLNEFESANLAELNEAGIKSVPLFVTGTGLDKGILDATEPMRALFRESGFHDYSQQRQGQESKVIREVIFLRKDGPHPISISLYRPQTKKGDPRFWIYGLKELAGAGDVVVVFSIDGRLHSTNLTRTRIASAAATSPVAQLLSPLRQATRSIADELLTRLRGIADLGPIQAVCKGDTAVGRSIETALGITINSSRKPDYKGIELKSGRSKLVSKQTRATLFACVPDWQLSALKSSKAILERFGYARNGDFKLYCSVSTQRANSQGLQLKLDEAVRWLREIAVRTSEEQVAVWQLNHLEKRLTEKHRETFWIKARAEKRADGEWFHLQSVTHTRSPNLPQLERMLGDGTVTLDHLIKRLPTGRAHEKGPLFKIDRQRISELFLGAPQSYSLAG